MAPRRFRRGLRRGAAALLKTLLAMALTMILLEAGVRLLLPQRSFSISVNTWDPAWGVRHIPGRVGFQHTPEFDVTLRINARGLRDDDHPYTAPPGVRRILCLGDSFTCGYGVEASETFPELLEDFLDKDGDRWAVINAGVGSTGTAHQLAWFLDEGRRYEADDVVLCFFPGNDFWDNAVAGIFAVEDGELVRRPAPAPGALRLKWLFERLPWHGRLLARSHAAMMLRRCLGAWHQRRLDRQDDPVEPDHAILAWRDDLTRRIFAALHAACREQGRRLHVMLMPAPDETDLPARTRALQSFLEDLGVDCLDLAPGLAARERAGEAVTFPRDGHWNAAGHREVARALHEFLAGRLAPSPASGSG